MTDDPLLRLEDVSKHFDQNSNVLESLLSREQPLKAVDEVSLTIERDSSQAVIGESGCGKSTLVYLIMHLLQRTSGTVYYKGEDVDTFGKAGMKEFRSNVQIIFQDPYNSFDPKLTIRESLKEPLKIHGFENHEERIRSACKEVQLQPPDYYLDKYPRELSGGELQRVSIARAIIIEPEVILADEPVSMLDVSTQASILTLLSDLQENREMAMLYISHDLSTVPYISEDTNVMYLGRIIERAGTTRILNEPKHPYTQELIKAVPIPNPHHKRERTTLQDITEDEGRIDVSTGCRFRDRCPEAMDVCEITPNDVSITEDHEVACHLYYTHEETPEQVESTHE